MKTEIKNKFIKELKNKKCVPHEKMVVLKQEEIKDYLSQLKDWEFLETNKITKESKFKDFKDAMDFVNKVAGIAEEESHHPDIAIHYNKVEITLWTHFINGLSINDFIMAAKIGNLI